MEKYLKYYGVFQGNLDENGNGYVHQIVRYENYEDAKKFYEKIKEDTIGYQKKPNGYLETYVAYCICNLEDDTVTENVMDLYDYKYEVDNGNKNM